MNDEFVDLLEMGFRKVVVEHAAKEGKTSWEAFVSLAIAGAEHKRLCEKQDHRRVGG